MAKLNKTDQILAENPGSFSDLSEAQRIYGGGRQMLPSEMGFSPVDQALLVSMRGGLQEPPKSKRSTYWDFSEWEKRQPGYGKVAAPKPKEEWGTVGPGKAPTALEQIAAHKRDLEKNYSSDEFAGMELDGKPRYQRGTSTGGGFDGERPPNKDGAADTAKDIYRESAKNYPKDAPEDVQAGFAVAASTHDYNNQGSTKGSTYANEEPLTSTVTQRDGRIGEDREMLDGSRFFVSADGKIILRQKNTDDK